jgi:hypothetical protein
MGDNVFAQAGDVSAAKAAPAPGDRVDSNRKKVETIAVDKKNE